MTEVDIILCKDRFSRLAKQFPQIHFFSNSGEGWCRASYKDKEQKLTYRMSKETIEMALYKLTQ